MQFLILAVCALACLPACSPTFNWRDIRPDGTALSLLMPCKPDKAQRVVPLGGVPAELMLLSCDAGGVTFAVSVADVGDPSKVPAALAQWQNATLANIKAPPATLGKAVKLPGLPSGALLVSALGQRGSAQAEGTEESIAHLAGS